MVDLGRIGFLPKGEWDPDINYEILDIVFEDNTTYIALKNSINKRPSTNPSSWQFVCSNPLEANFVKKTDLATTGSLGIVKTDGVTVQTNNDGVLSCKQATASHIGATRPDNNTLGVTEDGVLSIKAEYTRMILDAIAEGTGISYTLTEQDKNDISSVIMGMVTPTIGNLSNLQTTTKTNLVASINEIYSTLADIKTLLQSV